MIQYNLISRPHDTLAPAEAGGAHARWRDDDVAAKQRRLALNTRAIEIRLQLEGLQSNVKQLMADYEQAAELENATRASRRKEVEIEDDGGATLEACRVDALYDNLALHRDADGRLPLGFKPSQERVDRPPHWLPAMSTAATALDLAWRTAMGEETALDVDCESVGGQAVLALSQMISVTASLWTASEHSTGRGTRVQTNTCFNWRDLMEIEPGEAEEAEEAATAAVYDSDEEEDEEDEYTGMPLDMARAISIAASMLNDDEAAGAEAAEAAEAEELPVAIGESDARSQMLHILYDAHVE